MPQNHHVSDDRRHANVSIDHETIFPFVPSRSMSLTSESLQSLQTDSSHVSNEGLIMDAFLLVIPGNEKNDQIRALCLSPNKCVPPIIIEIVV